MPFSFAIGPRISYTALLAFLLLQAGFARERGPRVEVVCPSAPVPVKLAEQQVLVYELHATNFDAEPLTLKRLEVFADSDKRQPLSVISGDELSTIMLDVGSEMGAKAANVDQRAFRQTAARGLAPSHGLCDRSARQQRRNCT